MIEIALLVCALAQPADCREEHIPFQPPYDSVMFCAKDAMYLVVDWAQHHPTWTVRRWTCSPPKA